MKWDLNKCTLGINKYVSRKCILLCVCLYVDACFGCVVVCMVFFSFLFYSTHSLCSDQATLNVQWHKLKINCLYKNMEICYGGLHTTIPSHLSVSYRRFVVSQPISIWFFFVVVVVDFM